MSEVVNIPAPPPAYVKVIVPDSQENLAIAPAALDMVQPSEEPSRCSVIISRVPFRSWCIGEIFVLAAGWAHSGIILCLAKTKVIYSALCPRCIKQCTCS